MKKNIGTAISLIFVLFFVVCIGATLSAYKVMPQKVEVSKISIICAEGIVVTDKDGQQLNNLEVISSDMGVRPATGEEIKGSDIPSTINDEVGTEGAYACFYVSSQSPFKIVMAGCSVSKGSEENLSNIEIAMMEENGVSIKSDEVDAVLWEYETCKNKELAIVIWLDAKATESIAGGKIEIQLSFEYL